MRTKESKKAHFNGGFSHAKSGGNHLQQGQGLSKGSSQRFDRDRVSALKAQRDIVKGDSAIHPMYPQYGRHHVGMCLRGTGACFGCDKMGQKISECLNVATKGKEGRPQGQAAQRGQCNNVPNINEMVYIATDSMFYILGKRLKSLLMCHKYVESL